MQNGTNRAHYPKSSGNLNQAAFKEIVKISLFILYFPKIRRRLLQNGMAVITKSYTAPLLCKVAAVPANAVDCRTCAIGLVQSV